MSGGPDVVNAPLDGAWSKIFNGEAKSGQLCSLGVAGSIPQTAECFRISKECSDSAHGRMLLPCCVLG